MDISLHSYRLDLRVPRRAIRRNLSFGPVGERIFFSAFEARLKASRFDWSYVPSFAKCRLSEMRCRQRDLTPETMVWRRRTAGSCPRQFSRKSVSTQNGAATSSNRPEGRLRLSPPVFICSAQSCLWEENPAAIYGNQDAFACVSDATIFPSSKIFSIVVQGRSLCSQSEFASVGSASHLLPPFPFGDLERL